jgi:fructose-1,6-bisphosphatase/inositol monophosphatase family enzyme
MFDALKRELFVAARGRGARLNGRPIHMSATPSLGGALLATAFPYDQRRAAQFLFDLLGGLHDAHAGGAAHGFRRAGPLQRRLPAG